MKKETIQGKGNSLDQHIEAWCEVWDSLPWKIKILMKLGYMSYPTVGYPDDNETDNEKDKD